MTISNVQSIARMSRLSRGVRETKVHSFAQLVGAGDLVELGVEFLEHVDVHVTRKDGMD
jgi:hypothetical protein